MKAFAILLLAAFAIGLNGCGSLLGELTADVAGVGGIAGEPAAEAEAAPAAEAAPEPAAEAAEAPADEAPAEPEA